MAYLKDILMNGCKLKADASYSGERRGRGKHGRPRKSIFSKLEESLTTEDTELHGGKGWLRLSTQL